MWLQFEVIFKDCKINKLNLFFFLFFIHFSLTLAYSDGWCYHRYGIVFDVLPPVAHTVSKHIQHARRPSSIKLCASVLSREPEYFQTADLFL